MLKLKNVTNGTKNVREQNLFHNEQIYSNENKKISRTKKVTKGTKNVRTGHNFKMTLQDLVWPV